MHQYFANWYQDQGINPAGIDLAARWNGASSLVEPNDFNQYIALVALAFGRHDEFTAACTEELRAAVQAEDSSFLMRDNDPEVAILAGAACAAALETEADLAAFVSLQIAAGQFDGHEPSAQDLIVAADNRRREMAIARRVPAFPPTPRTPAATEEAKAARVALDELVESGQQDYAKLAKSMSDLLDLKEAGITSAHNQLSALRKSTLAAVDSIREETDMLWWVFTGWSSTRAEPWDAIPLEQRIYLAALELAELTQYIPGPFAAERFLARALGPDTEQLQSLTGGLPSDLAEHLPDYITSAPVGVVRRWASETQTAGAADRPAIEICIAAYNELLAARLFSNQ